MKKLLTIILIGLLVNVSFSCADLEENPVGLLSPEGFYKSKSDVESAIFGAYSWLASENIFGRQFQGSIMLKSDMVDIGNRSTSAERIQVNDFKMDDSNGMVARFWPIWFQIISAVNSAEDGALSLDLPEDEINPLIAEARFIRAFSYFHLVRCFGDLPYIDKFVNDPSSVKTISKTSETEIYNKIIADMEYAKQWLPDQQPNDIRTRPTAGTAASYLASIYLTLQDYQKAYTEAKYVIDNKDRFGYRLESDFQDLYRAELADQIKETIFAFDFLGQISSGWANDDSMGPMVGTRHPLAQGYGVLVPSMKVYETWDNRDYRKRVSFEDTLKVDGQIVPYSEFPEPRPHIAKWRRFPGNSASNARYSDYNYPDFRYAEVLLIAAEASAEISGPNEEAYAYLNQVRARARNEAGVQNSFPEDVPTNLSKDDFIDLIMDDRRLELAFEWKRWYDIKRRNLGEEVFKGTNSLEPRPEFDASRDYYYPIPRKEIDLNPNLKPQNPGY